ncbi:GTP cyclohydrolase II [Patescibacteria group bacterium]|nr:GTP cyclohydrolase II [Patescibacteria group bacterium]
MMKRDLYIIFGPPGSGKTAQATFLSEQLKLEKISWGNLYRDEAAKKKYRKEIAVIDNKKTSILKRSKAIASIINKEIDKLNGNNSNGLVLDGFPRRIEEARELKKMIQKGRYSIKALIRINPSLETAIARYNGRYICEKCHRYFTDFVPGKNENHCDLDGGRLKKVLTPPNKIKEDFFLYLHEVSGAIDYLKGISEAHFDVSGDEDDIVIFSNILMKLKSKVKDDWKIFRRQSSSLVETIYGDFQLISYQSELDYQYHLALVKGRVRGKSGVLLRIHSSCITGDIFGSYRCDCGDQLHRSLKAINKAGSGIVIYLFQEGRGINIINKLKAYKLQRDGADTVDANEMLGLPAELRSYYVVKDILGDLDVESVVLLTNNPDKMKKLTDLGVVVEGIKNIEIEPNKHNGKYLSTKKEKMGHLLKKV